MRHRISSALVSVAAWLAMLPASPFAVILCRVALHHEPPPWTPLLNLLASAVVLAVIYATPALRPLRGYSLSVTTLVLGYVLLFQIEGTPAWRARFSGAPVWEFVLADALVELIPCSFLALSLIGGRLTRRDLFLVRGELAAPCPLPFRWRVSWARSGPVLILLLAGPLFVQLLATVRPDAHLYGRAVRGLPLAVAFSVFNAAQEEFRFRAVLLARLVPVIGAAQALWITSTMFGLGHWFGHPSGPVGVAMAGFAGFVWGKSMLDTRGFAWAWIIHASMDLLIFTLLLMSGP